MRALTAIPPWPAHPLMVHRWGYTPKKPRAAFTQEAGLVNVREVAAQFKLRRPARSMRLVGEKRA